MIESTASGEFCQRGDAMLMPLAPFGFQGFSQISSKGFSSLNGPFQTHAGLLLFKALALFKTSLTIAELNLQTSKGVDAHSYQAAATLLLRVFQIFVFSNCVLHMKSQERILNKQCTMNKECTMSKEQINA